MVLQKGVRVTGKAIIVTEEAFNPSRPNKIPYVAQRKGVESINLDVLLRREGLPGEDG